MPHKSNFEEYISYVMSQFKSKFEVRYVGRERLG